MHRSRRKPRRDSSPKLSRVLHLPRRSPSHSFFSQHQSQPCLPPSLVTCPGVSAMHAMARITAGRPRPPHSLHAPPATAFTACPSFAHSRPFRQRIAARQRAVGYNAETAPQVVMQALISASELCCVLSCACVPLCSKRCRAADRSWGGSSYKGVHCLRAYKRGVWPSTDTRGLPPCITATCHPRSPPCALHLRAAGSAARGPVWADHRHVLTGVCG